MFQQRQRTGRGSFSARRSIWLIGCGFLASHFAQAGREAQQRAADCADDQFPRWRGVAAEDREHQRYHRAGDRAPRAREVARRLESALGALERPRPRRPLHPERHRLGVDAVRAADAQRLAELERAALAHLAEARHRVDGHEITVLLAKNPAGWIETLDVINQLPGTVVVAINAQGPDGRDPSWLWRPLSETTA